MATHRTLAHSHPRLVIALCLGFLIALFLPPGWQPITRVLIGWNAGAWAYLALMGWMMIHGGALQLRKMAEQEDNTRVGVLAVLSLAAVLSLVAIVMELASARDLPGSLRVLHYLVTAVTILGSWLLLAVIYTFHYAHLFYRAAPDRRPLRFPDEEAEPDCWDFLYFSFTIAVAAQTSDVSILSRSMRKAVMAQSVLSFLFNAAIIGLFINIAASLVGT